jgi:hypothetical protein
MLRMIEMSEAIPQASPTPTPKADFGKIGATRKSQRD